ncbi:hypothetical protein M758_12G157600 [Ceratodon purpureus]|uniref:Uncharacterized protein n=1 Tax=Ceratodon purpureus TaxID=3225 RepID=A0A8T0GDF3_CERPU|nr:hypothetical protein KC19_12G155100 [Ceratodon purpureus]KAG0599509.1 hypothetical protein M758_12G157600 [Ceratodon purpureus]
MSLLRALLSFLLIRNSVIRVGLVHVYGLCRCCCERQHGQQLVRARH